LINLDLIIGLLHSTHPEFLWKRTDRVFVLKVEAVFEQKMQQNKELDALAKTIDCVQLN